MPQDLGPQRKQLRLWTNRSDRQGHRDIRFINKGVGWGQAGYGGESEDHTAERSQEKASEDSQTLLHSLPLPTQGRQLWSSPQVLEVGTREASSTNLLSSVHQP